MSRRGARSVLCVLVTSLLAVASSGQEPQQATSGAPLRFGMSAAISGPARDLGINMRDGLRAAFHECNGAGGVHGRQLELIVLDDGYEPARVVPNMNQLIDDRGVLAVIGNVGTPTAIAAIPIVNEKHVPFIGAFTGAGLLRRLPPDRYVINYRASYAEEIAAMVAALVKRGRVRPHEIAFFTQRDASGDSGYSAGIRALKRHGLLDETRIAHGRYDRNSTAVENALADILEVWPVPRAIIMVGSYEPCAAFIKLARQHGLDALFLNMSLVGSTSLTAAVDAGGRGVIVTQVVPHFDSDEPLVADYRKQLARVAPDAKPTFGSLEGFIVGRILRLALDRIGRDVTREAIVDALEGLGTFDVGLGFQLELSDARHQASRRVWPTVIRKGRIEPFDWKRISNLLPPTNP